jgi:hypothetical protein
MAVGEMSRTSKAPMRRLTKAGRMFDRPKPAGSFVEAWAERHGALNAPNEPGRLVRRLSAVLIVIVASLVVTGGLV